MNFKVVKTISGKVRVKYACPHCNESLESELAEAGSRDTCPQCQKPFVVPGEAKRKEFEAQLRQQLEAKKEAERQRLAEIERQRLAEAEAQAQRDAERVAEQAAVKGNEAVAFTYQPPAMPAQIAQDHNSIPSNIHYPALEFYIRLLRISGWVCIGLFGLYVILFGGAALIAPAFSRGELS